LNYAITIDWLSLTVRGSVASLPECPVGFRLGEFVFVRLETGTRHYKNLVKIQYKGLPWGEMAFTPHSRILPPDSCQMKLENNVLYEESLGESLRHFFDLTKFKIQSIARLDIAFDFERFVNGWGATEFVQQLQSNQIMRLGREAQFHTYYKGHVLTGCKWGSLTSDRTFTLYNKTLELKGKSKPYINEYHKNNGLGVDCDVWRLEAKLKSDELKKMFNTEHGNRLDLFDFLEPDWLAQVFEKELESYLTFVFPTNERKSRCAVVPLIMLTKHVPQKLLRFSTRPGASNFRFKISIKSLLQEYYTTKNNRALSMACEIMDVHGLIDHTEKRLSFWLREFYSRMDIDYNYACPVALARSAMSLEELERNSYIKSVLPKETFFRSAFKMVHPSKFNQDKRVYLD
jgi:hypothetical protein